MKLKIINIFHLKRNFKCSSKKCNFINCFCSIVKAFVCEYSKSTHFVIKIQSEKMSSILLQTSLFVCLLTYGYLGTEIPTDPNLISDYIEDISYEADEVVENPLLNRKWNTSIMYYKVSYYSSKLSASVIDTEIKRAFDIWNEQINFQMIAKPVGVVDVEIKFISGDHGHKINFHNSLSHSHATQIHFNDDFNWTFNSTQGNNLFQAAVHEIGHVLGLAHSSRKNSVMFPHAQDYSPYFQLYQYDIEVSLQY